MSFGLDENDSGPLEIQTPRGRTVALRGKIDRIDVQVAGSQLVASVVDYKLTARQLRWPGAHAGIALQLMTYLLVLTEKGAALLGQPVQTAGALFVGISRILRSADHPNDEPLPDDPDYWNAPEHKPRGLINVGHLPALEPAFEGRSVYFVGTRPAKSEINSDFITDEGMQVVLQWTRKKLGELADEIADGNIVVHPYRIGTSVPCGSCSYRAVCRFDRFINRYKEIKGGRASEIIQLMRSEVGR